MMDKQAWREKIWGELERSGAALFPGARGRIPNFVGAEESARLLAEQPEWTAAKTIKANPDSPQRFVRELALKHGKRVYMAVPRLRQERCFIELDPDDLGSKIPAAASIRGAFHLGRPIGVQEMPPIDLVVAGSVAVGRRGVRIGKGGGYSDLEYALGRELGFVRTDTPVATTVHSLQVVDDELPRTDHDFDVDLIVTPELVIRPPQPVRKSPGIIWTEPSAARLAGIPVLARMAAARPAT
jgi:5-formyltetrahydrofolate cyclo-ligase